MPSFKEIEDEDTKTAIHKRKILNMIAQGEAINSKKMLLSDTNMDGLTELFGKDSAEKMADLLIKITDICNARDWRIPEEVAASMIEQGGSLSGVSKIEWKPNEPKSDDSEETQNDEEGSEEDHSTDTAKLIILGMDQAMLFHEAVKAIYGLINQGGLAHLDDETIAKVFMNADTARDEAQDLKRAKLTAADLRDFIQSFPELNDIENGREYVWGKMIDASVLNDSEFLNLMNMIFTSAPEYRTLKAGEPEYTQNEIDAARKAYPIARKKVQDIIDLILQELSDWEASQEEPYGSEYEEPGQADFDIAPSRSSEPSRAEIQDMIDQALDRRDFAEVERLSKSLENAVR